MYLVFDTSIFNNMKSLFVSQESKERKVNKLIAYCIVLRRHDFLLHAVADMEIHAQHKRQGYMYKARCRSVNQTVEGVGDIPNGQKSLPWITCKYLKVLVCVGGSKHRKLDRPSN